MSKVFAHTVCTKHAKQWLILQTAVIGTVCLSLTQTLVPHLRLYTDIQIGVFLLSANNCFSFFHFLLSQYIERRINGTTVVNIDVRELYCTCFSADMLQCRNLQLEKLTSEVTQRIPATHRKTVKWKTKTQVCWKKSCTRPGQNACMPRMWPRFSVCR